MSICQTGQSIAEFGEVLTLEEYNVKVAEGSTKKGYAIEIKKGLFLDCYVNAKVKIHQLSN